MYRCGKVVKKLVNAVTVTTSTTIDVSDLFNGIQFVGQPLFTLVATENSGTATLDIDVNVSQDNGSNYDEVLSFTQLSASGREVKNPTVGPWGEKVQVEVTLSAAADWTFTLYVSGPALGAAGQ